jgi:hypothetical protein
MGSYLRFQSIGRGKTAVYSGTKRVGTIEMDGKYIRAESRYLDAIQSYVASMR